jgi:hypothetical protein
VHALTLCVSTPRSQSEPLILEISMAANSGSPQHVIFPPKPPLREAFGSARAAFRAKRLPRPRLPTPLPLTTPVGVTRGGLCPPKRELSAFGGTRSGRCFLAEVLKPVAPIQEVYRMTAQSRASVENCGALGRGASGGCHATRSPERLTRRWKPTITLKPRILAMLVRDGASSGRREGDSPPDVVVDCHASLSPCRQCSACLLP